MLPHPQGEDYILPVHRYHNRTGNDSGGDHPPLRMSITQFLHGSKPAITVRLRQTMRIGHGQADFHSFFDLTEWLKWFLPRIGDELVHLIMQACLDELKRRAKARRKEGKQ